MFHGRSVGRSISQSHFSFCRERTLLSSGVLSGDKMGQLYQLSILTNLHVYITYGPSFFKGPHIVKTYINYIYTSLTGAALNVQILVVFVCWYCATLSYTTTVSSAARLDLMRSSQAGHVCSCFTVLFLHFLSFDLEQRTKVTVI